MKASLIATSALSEATYSWSEAYRTVGGPPLALVETWIAAPTAKR